MGDAQHNSHLSRANQLSSVCFLIALAAAALSLLAGCRAEEKAAPPSRLTPQQERGRQLFATNCLMCHETTSSAEVQGPSLHRLYRKGSLPSGAPANDDRVRDAILLGRPNMPGYQNVLTGEQINDLLAYLRTL
jgi:mono/diheme cytochrome c family protein